MVYFENDFLQIHEIHCNLSWIIEFSAKILILIKFRKTNLGILKWLSKTSIPHSTIFDNCQSPSQSAPPILKNRAPCFLKIGHPAFCKKQAEKNRVIFYSKREETRLPLLFLINNDLAFLHSAVFKKQGAHFSKSRVPNF